MCLNVVSGERRIWQLTKATLAERTISAATATFICVVISAATRWSRSLKVVLQNAQFPQPQRHFSCVPRKVWSVFWACTISRAAVNVQLHNVAVVGEIVRPAAMFSSSTQNLLY